MERKTVVLKSIENLLNPRQLDWFSYYDYEKKAVDVTESYSDLDKSKCLVFPCAEDLVSFRSAIKKFEDFMHEENGVSLECPKRRVMDYLREKGLDMVFNDFQCKLNNDAFLAWLEEHNFKVELE